MPRGVYPRRARKAKGRRVRSAAVVQPVAKLAQPVAIAAFKAHAIAWRRQSLTLGCAAAVCLIVGAYGKRAIEQDVTIAKLKDAVGATGIQDSQVAKYIGLARALVNHLSTRFKVGGPMHDVLKTTSADRAIDALADYLTKEKVTTLEGMSKLLGKYRRAPTTARRPVTPTVQPAPAGKGEQRPVRIGRAGTVERMPSGRGLPMLNAEALRTVTAELIVLAAEQAGHSPVTLASAAIASVTKTKDLLTLEGLISSRMNELSPAKARALPPSKRAAA